MNSQAAVINVSGDYEETILQFAKHLGRAKIRRDVFNLIYGRGTKPRSKKQICDQLGRTGNTQVIQDALEYLSNHHLVVRVENSGQVQDGSRWLYAKAEPVRANRDKIVKFADNPSAAKRVPTKRRPASDIKLSLVKPKGSTSRRSNTVTRAARTKVKLKIALLVTNPDLQASLQTGVEARYIEEGILLGNGSGAVDLKIVPAPTLNSLLDMLNRYQPDIVHFSGHGGGRALVFDNNEAGDDGGTVLDFDMIARVVGATSARPKLLVLVACDTVDGAERFLDAVPAVIAMADSIEDKAACAFSARFYRSLSAGATISQSLEQAKLVLESEGYSDSDLPTLIVKNDKAKNSALL